ncbi:biotin--[acetyl-CoA-carboxylase] ligase [Agathobacter ruminis]|uniref:Bifunctional ligase/repressor BirA n=1 Tax=Agathobacter ruminis TaxID=1712665 RepID=A0A2G3E5U2_9FIRM|nr:biotin--[acetyl-CoA-carboxylase] ligase [Agathobacter ruminis]MDC7301664.1 biotin--[acetyl-CoA-carboxylase] ligase [Agathobacter ruminis]PHU38646.1 biotin--[acetyl-CoA-carboxylase] ligase [Agathobacter ruminis]
MKTKIIAKLHEREGFVSSQELCDEFNVSRTAVWKVINQLKEQGYEIEAVPRKGYRLLESPDRMTAAEIRAAITRPTGEMGNEILSFDTIDSTNTKAAELATAGQPSGLLVVSEEQTSGKGRRGRSWSSPFGKGIFMTLMIKPDIQPNHASMLTLVAALAIAKAIGRMTEQADVKIKWPNDIVVNGKKVVGILTEMSAQIDYINHIVIGIGINVHNEDFPEEIKETATSLYRETGVHFKRAQIIAAFLEEFYHDYQIYLQTEDLTALEQEYNACLINCNRQVRVLDPKGEFEGIARGINPQGELLVETTDSNGNTCVRPIASGEVSVRGIYGYV